MVFALFNDEFEKSTETVKSRETSYDEYLERQAKKELGGRNDSSVLLPSDMLSREEIESLSSPVKTYFIDVKKKR